MKQSGRFLQIVIALFILSSCSQQGTKWHATNITGVMPDLSFTLTDPNGKPVTANRYRGKINILFFGYTNCPDVCPLTLGKLAGVLRGFTPAERKQFNVLFVSVDPSRDTAPVRKQYCAAFGPAFYGLSGTMKQLRQLTRRYRVTFSYGKKDKDNNYVVSHSSAIYIFDPANKVRLLTSDAESSKDLTHDLLQLHKLSSSI